MIQHGNRRQFLGAATAAALGSQFAAARSANEKLNIGVIGCAAQGAYNWGNMTSENIVAVCDVDEARAAAIRSQFPRAKYFADFRRMLEQKGLDAVVVSTPDHTHAPATLMALRSGLHVYCEKPLTHTVAEARLVANTARENKRVTQMGTQIHNSGGNYRRVVELIRSGAIGSVREVLVWVDVVYSGGDRPKEAAPVPKGLHFDLWLGPAPQRPYNPVYLPFWWRGWWDFGGGGLADMACHYMDLPHWALDLRHPEKVFAEGPAQHPESTPSWQIVHYEYPASEQRPPVKLTWHHGGKRPEKFRQVTDEWKGSGVLFVGDRGMLVSNYGKHRLLPAEKFVDFKPPTPSIPDSIGHHREWIEACKTGAPTTCNFDYSGALTEAVLLGNVAYRLGRPITWDAQNLRAVNDAEADRYIHKTYRKGWEIT